jgi:polysaccharide pyruvyl transferase WcaK-like protein
MSVIAGSEMLVGGRFHLAIFAALQGTPVVPFEGNTHKIKGLVELLAYPIGSIEWKEQEIYPAQIKNVFENREELGELLRVRSHDLANQVSRIASLDSPG